MVAYLGDCAIPFVEKAIRLSPRDPNVAGHYWALGACHLLLGHADQAAGSGAGIATLNGLPATTMPNGRSESGLPIGVQIIDRLPDWIEPAGPSSIGEWPLAGALRPVADEADYVNKSLPFSRLSTRGGPRLSMRALIVIPLVGSVGSLKAFATAGMESHLARSWGKRKV